MGKEMTQLEALEELPEDYKFVYKIKGCEQKFDFDTNTIVDKILSTRAKKVDEEVIRQLRNIGEAKGINELILIDESKVLNMIKSLKALEIIKEKVMPLVNLDEGELCKDHYRVYDGELYMYTELTKEEYDLLKEALKNVR
jgi:hypothetical protein